MVCLDNCHQAVKVQRAPLTLVAGRRPWRHHARCNPACLCPQPVKQGNTSLQSKVLLPYTSVRLRHHLCNVSNHQLLTVQTHHLALIAER